MTNWEPHIRAVGGNRQGVLTAIVTIHLLYMIKLGGVGFSRFGTQGLLWTDAGANLLMFLPERVFDKDMTITFGGEAVMLHSVPPRHA